MNAEPTLVRNPYVGPRPFETHHRDRFFGRKREVNELLSLVVSERLVLIYAQSGAGKTSLINAGLIPALKEEGFEILAPARVQGVIPEGKIRLGFALVGQELVHWPAPTAGQQVPQPVATVDNPYILNVLLSWSKERADPRRLARTSLTDFLREQAHDTDEIGLPAPRALILDQFEELFTAYEEHWTKREDFFRQLAAALKEDPVLRVVLVMREDTIAQLDSYAPLLPGNLRARFHLERLRRAAAREAIVGPLPEGYAYAEGVIERLLKDLLKVQYQRRSGETVTVQGEFVEPVQLQIVCASLWRQLSPGETIIGQSSLRDLGDVTGALRAFYEDCIRKTARETDASEDDLHTWFKENLITTAGTRGTVFQDQSRRYTGTGRTRISSKAVDMFENMHLIRGGERAGGRWYELTHDRFIEPIREAFKGTVEPKDAQSKRLARLEKEQRIADRIGFPLLFVLLPLLAALSAGQKPIWVLLTPGGAIGRFSASWPLAPGLSALVVVLAVGALRWLVEMLLRDLHLETTEITLQGFLLLIALFAALPLLWMWTFAEDLAAWEAALFALVYLASVIMTSVIAIEAYDAVELRRWTGGALLFCLAPVLAAFVVEDKALLVPQVLAVAVERFHGFWPFGPWLSVLVVVLLIALVRCAAQVALSWWGFGTYELTLNDVLLQVVLFAPLALLWLWTFRKGITPDEAAVFGFAYVASTLLSSVLAVQLSVWL